MGLLCEKPIDGAENGSRQGDSGHRRGDDVVVPSSSINWLLFSIAIVLFLLVALLLVICYMRHNLIAKFEQSLEANKTPKTVIKFPPPPPIPTKDLPYLEEGLHSPAGKTKNTDNKSHSFSIGADSGIYSGEERYVSEPTSRVAAGGNYSGIVRTRPQSQCIRWSRLGEEERAKSGEEPNLQYCPMNFMVDTEETSLYELIDDEALSIPGAPLASDETLK